MKYIKKLNIKKLVSSCKNIKSIKLDKEHLYIIMALFFIGVFIVVLTSSYAFFSTTIRGKEYVVSTGTLSVTFQSNNSSFNLTGQYPKKDSEGRNTTPYTFGVKNTGTLVARYQVRLVLDDSQSNIPLEYVKIMYKKNNGSYSDPIRLSDLNTNLVITSNDEIDPNDTDNFELKMWIDYDAPIEVAGKKFKGKIVIDAIQNSDDGYVVSGRPAIKLNKDSEGNIDMLLNVGDTFTDPGVEKVLDDKDVFTTSDVAVNSNVNTSVAGIYNVTYTVTDSDGNASNVVRTVAVGDEETLELYNSISSIITAYSTDSSKKAIMCSHIYASTDIYFNCEEQTSIETAMSTRNIGAIILKDDVTKGTTTTLTTGQEYVLILNGHNITGTMNSDGKYSFVLQGDSKLDVHGENGGIIGNNRSFSVQNNSSLSIDGGNYKNTSIINDSIVNIKNCSFETVLTQKDVYPLYFNGTSKSIVDNISVYSPGKAFGVGAGAYVKVTNSNFECYQDNCVYIAHHADYSVEVEIDNSIITSYGYGIRFMSDGTLTVRKTTINAGSGSNSYGVNSEYAGTINIIDSNITSAKGKGVDLSQNTLTTSHVNIYNSSIVSKNETIYNSYGNNEINIYSGYIKSESNVGIYAKIGTININQTDKPLYITSTMSSSDYAVIVNSITGEINITAQKADQCTSNKADTTSGLCVYAGDNIRRAILNYYDSNYTDSQSIINVNGGTYYGGYIAIDNAQLGTINIENAELSSGSATLRNWRAGKINVRNTKITAINNRTNYGIQNNSTGIVKVCDTTIESGTGGYDLINGNTGTISYSNVTFSDGTKTLTKQSNATGGTIEEINACPITAQDLQ